MSGEPLVLVEIQWRRANPVNNPVWLLRSLESDDFPARRTVLARVFTRDYDLATGGYLTRRRNAEFAGRLPDGPLSTVSDRAFTLDVALLRGTASLPAGWCLAVEPVSTRVAGTVAADCACSIGKSDPARATAGRPTSVGNQFAGRPHSTWIR